MDQATIDTKIKKKANLFLGDSVRVSLKDVDFSKFEINNYDRSIYIPGMGWVAFEYIENLEEVMAMWSTDTTWSGTSSTLVYDEYRKNINKHLWSNNSSILGSSIIDTVVKPKPKRKLSFKEEMEKELKDWWVEF